MSEQAEKSGTTFLDRQFGLTQHSTTVRTEFVAAVTTSLTMVYIVFVNPVILANTGMDKGAVFVATCLAASVSTAIAMPLTYSIATGIGLGFITYAVIKILAGRFSDAKPAVLVLAVVFAAKFAIG